VIDQPFLHSFQSSVDQKAQTRVNGGMNGGMNIFKDIAKLTEKGAKHARAEIIGLF